MSGPIELAAIVTAREGRVIGFTDMDACRAWLAANDGWTVWTAEGFWLRERDEREKPR